jgi:hypothetical protein
MPDDSDRSHSATHHPSPPRSSPTPPPAPLISRRLAPTPKQWIGLPLLAAIPILTLFGVFGERRAIGRASSSAIEMTVNYPDRFRYRQVQPLDVSVRNVSGRAIDSVTVSLDTAYISRFSSVRIDPAPRVAYEVSLGHLAPGESRIVAAELWGQHYGAHRGRIIATVPGVTRADTLSVDIRTIVFP